MLRKHLIIILLFFTLPPAFGQAPAIHFRHIRYEDGLSNSTIECIFQDSRGFIWFGTRDGLNRYDGFQFKIFKTEPGNNYSISDNYITSIYENGDGKIWVGTTNGLNCFNPVLNRFDRYKHDAANRQSINNNYITSIIEDSEKKLWISTLGGGISSFNRKDKTFTPFRKNDNQPYSPADDKVYCLFCDSHGHIWAGTEKGIQLFDPAGRLFSTPPILKKITYPVLTIKEDKAGNLLAGTSNNGLFLFNQSFNTIRQFMHTDADKNSLSSNLVRDIEITAKGNIWIGTVNGGLDLFDPGHNRFYNYHHEIDNPQSLSQRTVSALLEDNQENLWIGTHRGGINLYTPKSEKFDLVQENKEDNSISYNDIKSFCEDSKGNIWIGTDGGGLNLYNRITKKCIHYKYNPANKQSLAANEVIAIAEDSKKNLWVGTWGGGLCLFNSASNSFTRFTHNPADSSSVSSNYIQAVFEDSKKRLWVATYYGGINLFDTERKKFTRVITGRSGKTKLTGNNVVSINEDHNGNIWMGTDDGGLNCLMNKTGEFIHYFNTEENLPDLRIIFTDHTGRIWAGQKGLYLFNEKQNRFIVYTTKAGLSGEFIKGILEDNSGVFWISTSDGITQFNPETLSFRKYNAADGLQGREFEANAFLQTKDGEFFFGGVNGFNSFYPRNIKLNNFIPPVYITGFQLPNDEKVASLAKDISYADDVHLNYRQSAFTISFAALNYTASENNRFAYKLENWDKDWITGTEKKVSYNNVSPGTYIFRVKASNNDGAWNEKEKTIEIIITPPFWNTWWFKTLLILFAGFAVFRYYSSRQKLMRRKLEEEKKEEIHQSQLQFFTNISHEFRTPLSLILGPAEKLMNEDNKSAGHHYYKVIYRNAQRLMNLINELMDFRKAESGILKLNVMPGNAEIFLQEIQEEFIEMAGEKNIKLSVAASLAKNDIWFDRQVLEKILVNLVGNSFKYTAAGGFIKVEATDSLKDITPVYAHELHIAGEYTPLRSLYLRVTDNGIGISQESMPHLFERYYRVSDSHMGSGIGLAFVKTITLLHKGSIRVYSERNKGTDIIITIPCAKDDYKDHEKWMNEGKIKLNFDIPSLAGAEKKHIQPIEADEKKQNRQPYTILIADDHEELRTFLKQSLSGTYKIIEAANGADGIALAKSAFPDLVISDIMMPVMNGVEFCRLLKNDIEISHIPFMMLTAKDSLPAKIEGTDAGADYYFTKPVSIDLLLSTLDNIFKQREKLREKYHRDHYREVRDIVNTGRDREFLEQLISIIEEHLGNPDMDVNYICRQIGMSRTRLHTKISSITGQPISDFIRGIRLKKAAQLLSEQDASIADVMYRVGIQTQSYFTKVFREEFGKTPAQFVKDLGR